MPINIITHGMKRAKVSNEETAETLARMNDEAVIREKHTYKERARQIRKEAENFNPGKGIRIQGVYDARTLMMHEAERPGCTSDPEYMRQLMRDNEEMRM